MILEELVPRMRGWQVKDLGDSLDAAGRSVRRRTQSLEGLGSIGKACFTLDRLDSCEEIFSNAVIARTRDDLAYRYLGRRTEAGGALDESLSRYRMAAKIHDTAEARSGVQRVHRKLKDSRIKAGHLRAYSN